MNRRLLRSLPFLAAFSILPGLVLADTLQVRKDGSGDFTTIGGAVAVAVAGDVIEVGPGTYPEKVDVFVRLTFVSTDGAAATILDGQGTQYTLWFRAGTGHVADGFTFTNGFHVSGGGAIRCQAGATLTLRNSTLSNNSSGHDGGAIFTRDTGSFIDAYDCLFTGNYALHNGGAGIAILGSRINYTRCTFMTNSAGEQNGGASCDNSTMDVRECLFVNNSSPSFSCVYYHIASGNVERNTFYNNHSGEHGSVVIQDSNVSVTRNIFASDSEGYGLAWLTWEGSHSCNLYDQNFKGAISNASLSGDEVEASPVFCDAASGDFTISIQSQAAPANSACGQLIGRFPTACDIAPPPPPPPPVVGPVILTITDVPNDQGNQVRIRWERSDYDALDEDYLITGYAIYRHQGEFVAGSKLPAGPRASGAQSPAIDGWDYIATVPARGDDIYQYVAPTLCNKPKNGDPCWSVFFVSAMTPYPLVYFDSAPDSGYSEDNLPPGPPASFSVAVTSLGAELEWGTSPSADAVQYRIYRAEGTDPVPGPSTLIHSTADHAWVDSEGTFVSHYRVSAIDENGNEGASVMPGAVTAVEDAAPMRYMLRQNTPNPFNPSTRIAFDVPAGGGHVRIDIFDVAGRQVRTLVDEDRGAGTWATQWDGSTDNGSRASSGVYFYRMRAGNFEQTLRMTLLQ